MGGIAPCVITRSWGKHEYFGSLGHYRYGVQWLKDERRGCIAILISSSESDKININMKKVERGWRGL